MNGPVVRRLRTKNLLGKGGIGLGVAAVACGFWLDGPLPIVEGAGGVVAVGSGIVYIDALLQFRDQVKNGSRWDFKDEIGLELGPGFTLCSSSECDTEIEHSVPGNIFFGYIGCASGFTGFELRAGAGWTEWRDPAHEPTSSEYTGPYEGEIHIGLSRPRLWNLADELIRFDPGNGLITDRISFPEGSRPGNLRYVQGEVNDYLFVAHGDSRFDPPPSISRIAIDVQNE